MHSGDGIDTEGRDTLSLLNALRAIAVESRPPGRRSTVESQVHDAVARRRSLQEASGVRTPSLPAKSATALWQMGHTGMANGSWWCGHGVWLPFGQGGCDVPEGLLTVLHEAVEHRLLPARYALMAVQLWARGQASTLRAAWETYSQVSSQLVDLADSISYLFSIFDPSILQVRHRCSSS